MERVWEPVQMYTVISARELQTSASTCWKRTLADEVDAESDSEASAFASRCFKSAMDPRGAVVLLLLLGGLHEKPSQLETGRRGLATGVVTEAK